MKRLLISTFLGLAALSATAAKADTTLVVAIAADPTGLDPEAVLNNTSGFVMATIYDSLVKYKAGSVDVEPGLAESWEASEDGLTYTFHLRKGVTFHDGTPLTGPNYIQTIKRLVDKQDPDSIFKTGPVEGYIDDTYGEVTSYTAPDDNTVVFKFKESSAPFTTNLAMVWNGVVSPTAVHKWGKDFRNHPVGTGPFIFKEWRQGDQVVLDANPNYWGGKPKVDHLVFKVMPDAQAALLAIKRGDVHILADVGAQTIPAAQGDTNLVVVTPARPCGQRRRHAVRRQAVQRQARPPGAQLRDRSRRHRQVAVPRPCRGDDLAAAGSAMGLRSLAEGLSLRSRQGEADAGRCRLSQRLQERAADL